MSINCKSIDFVVKVGGLVGLVVLCVAVELLEPGFYEKVAALATDKDAMISYLQGFGGWAMLVSFCLDVIINAVGFLPSVFISTANGLVFGLPWGITISWLAETTGVTISFILMRFFFRDAAKLLIEKSNRLQQLDEAGGKDGFWWMLFARMMPYFPSGVLTAMGAVSSMSFQQYFLANLIGKFPSTALEVVVGHDLVNLEEQYHRLALWAAIIAVMYIAGRYWSKRKEK